MTGLERGFQAVFRPYLRWLLRRSFRGLWIAQRSAFPAGGFVAVANHTSWWDGFVPYAVQLHLAPQTPFAVMMDGAQLKRFPYFRWGGAFGIDASSKREAHRSIEYAARTARDGAGVWIFPQGEIASPAAPLHFASGYLHAARLAEVPIVPVALRFFMSEAQRPDAFMGIGEPLYATDPRAAAAVPAAISQMLSSLDRAMERGSAFDGRVSIFKRAPGIDDVASGILGSEHS